MQPRQWDSFPTGVKRKLAIRKKVIALTFDACGGVGGMDYDHELIDYLKKNHIKANLFISAEWIQKNRDVFKELAAESLFEIHNHGFKHKPCSVNAKSKYKIKGTKNVAEAFDEIELNARVIEGITGKKTKFYRSGTAYYDEVCVQIAEEIGHQVVGWDILSFDYSAKTTKNKIKKNLLSAKRGSIFMAHMNKPKGNTYEAVKEAIPRLKKRGYRFVHLSEYPLK